MLLVLGGNPVYTAPVRSAIRRAGSARRRLAVHLGLYQDETAERAHWHIPEAHYLETWGDGRAYDGTASIVQPLIAPLYRGRSAIELLSALAGRVAAHRPRPRARATGQSRLNADAPAATSSASGGRR